MAGVNVPSSPQGPLQGIVPMVGAAVGGYFGGPAGAMAGSKVGQGLVSAGPDPSAVQSGAIDRRIGSMQDSPQMGLAQASAALQQLPPEYQQAYGPTLAAAAQRAQQGGP